MRVTSDYFPTLGEIAQPTGKVACALLYKNLDIKPFQDPVAIRVAQAQVPIVRGNVRSGKDFRRELRVDIGSRADMDLRIPLTTVQQQNLASVLNDLRVAPLHGSLMVLETDYGLRGLYVSLENLGGSYLNGVRIVKYNLMRPREEQVSFGRLLRESDVPANRVFEFDLFVCD